MQGGLLPRLKSTAQRVYSAQAKLQKKIFLGDLNFDKQKFLLKNAVTNASRPVISSTK